MQFRSEDERAFIQVSPHFLAVNHLKPYPFWETFSSNIQKGFNAYCHVTNPSTIERIQLQYINNIVFEEKKCALKKFFNFYPFLGTGLPQDYVSFFTGIQTPFADGRDILKIELTGRPMEEDQISIFLNLDYSLMQIGSIAPNTVLEWVNEAHQRIEEAFEACITDLLREKFDKERTL